MQNCQCLQVKSIGLRKIRKISGILKNKIRKTMKTLDAILMWTFPPSIAVMRSWYYISLLPVHFLFFLWLDLLRIASSDPAGKTWSVSVHFAVKLKLVIGLHYNINLIYFLSSLSNIVKQQSHKSKNIACCVNTDISQNWELNYNLQTNNLLIFA